MNKILYTRFGDTSPTIARVPKLLTTITPPLIPYDGGLDLDYLPLILFDKAVIDKESMEYVITSGDPALRRACESLTALRDEGFVEADFSFRERLMDFTNYLHQVDDDALLDYQSWVPLVQQAARNWIDLASKFEETVKHPLPEENKTPFGIFHYLMEKQGVAPAAERARLTQLLLKHRPTTRDRDAQDVQRHVVNIYLANVHAVLMMSRELDVTWYDWGNMGRFYERKFLQVANKQVPGGEMDTVRRFFDEAFVLFRPQSVSDLIRILRNPHIKALRKEIQEAAADGRVLNHSYAGKAIQALEEAKGRVKRIVDITGYLTIPLGFVPIVGAFGKLIEKGIEKVAEMRYLEPHRYLYFTGLVR